MDWRAVRTRLAGWLMRSRLRSRSVSWRNISRHIGLLAFLFWAGKWATTYTTYAKRILGIEACSCKRQNKKEFTIKRFKETSIRNRDSFSNCVEYHHGWYIDKARKIYRWRYSIKKYYLPWRSFNRQRWTKISGSDSS